MEWLKRENLRTPQYGRTLSGAIGAGALLALVLVQQPVIEDPATLDALLRPYLGIQFIVDVVGAVVAGSVGDEEVILEGHVALLLSGDFSE
jgi:hypothetical protein